MARHVLHGAVPLAVLPIGGRLEDACPVRTGTLELGTDVLDPDPDEMRHPTVVCWLPVPALRDDHCSIYADAHLRPVTLSPIRVRSTKPNAALSHATAARTSG